MSDAVQPTEVDCAAALATNNPSGYAVPGDMLCEFGVYPPGTESNPEYVPEFTYQTNCIDSAVAPLVQSAYALSNIVNPILGSEIIDVSTLSTWRN